MQIDINKLRSDAEKEFYAWLLESEQAGLIQDIQYESQSFELISKKTIIIEKQLKTKTKTIEKTLLLAHSYTPDFVFKVSNERFKQLFYAGSNNLCFTDIKGTWSNRGSLQEFSINKKLMFDRFNIYINKIIPADIFKKTFCPEYARFSLIKKKERDKYLKYKTISEYLKII